VQAFIFDVDNTLTPPRRPLEPEMVAALKALKVPFHVAAGSHLPLVEEQLVEPLHQAGFHGRFDAFVCNGSDRYRFDLGAQVRCEALRTFSLRDHLGAAAFQSLMGHLAAALQHPTLAIDDPAVQVIGEQIVDRGSMINFAPIGRPLRMDANAYDNRDRFVAFDERSGYRQRARAHLQATLKPLCEAHGLRITLGGQTSFDLVIAGNDKTFPLRTLYAEGYVDLTYFGDALFEGGNDAAVLDFIGEHSADSRIKVRAIQVVDWRDTLEKMRVVSRRAGGGS
jgi:phosphomannomutase